MPDQTAQFQRSDFLFLLDSLLSARISAGVFHVVQGLKAQRRQESLYIETSRPYQRPMQMEAGASGSSGVCFLPSPQTGSYSAAPAVLELN